MEVRTVLNDGLVPGEGSEDHELWDDHSDREGDESDEVDGVPADNTGKEDSEALQWFDYAYICVLHFGTVVYASELTYGESPLNEYGALRNGVVTFMYLVYYLVSISRLTHRLVRQNPRCNKEKVKQIHPGIGAIMFLQFVPSLVVYGSKGHYISSRQGTNNQGLYEFNRVVEDSIHFSSVLFSCLIASNYSVYGVIDNFSVIFDDIVKQRNKKFCFSAMVITSMVISIPTLVFEVVIRNKLSSAPCEEYLHGSCQYFFYANAFFTYIWNTGRNLTLFSRVLFSGSDRTLRGGNMLVISLLISTASVSVTMYPALYKELHGFGLNDSLSHIIGGVWDLVNSCVFFAFHISRNSIPTSDSQLNANEDSPEFSGVSRVISDVSTFVYNFIYNNKLLFTLLALHLRVGDLTSTSVEAIKSYDPERKDPLPGFGVVLATAFNYIWFLLLSRGNLDLSYLSNICSSCKFPRKQNKDNITNENILEAGGSYGPGVFPCRRTCDSDSSDGLEEPLLGEQCRIKQAQGALSLRAS